MILCGEHDGGDHSRRGKRACWRVAIGTKFGWVLSGPVENMSRILSSNVNLAATHVLRVDHQPVLEQNKDEMPDKRVNQLFDLETLGISETDSVHESFLQNNKSDNNQYSVKLPWREHHLILPDNCQVSVNRLVSSLQLNAYTKHRNC